jgi:hypothetical protein
MGVLVGGAEARMLSTPTLTAGSAAGLALLLPRDCVPLGGEDNIATSGCFPCSLLDDLGAVLMVMA